MNNLTVIEKEKYIEIKIQSGSLNYTDDLAVMKLLDTIANIIADEYIIKVKQNPGIFLDNGGGQ